MLHKSEPITEVNDKIFDSNCFIYLFPWSWDGILYCFEFFSWGVKAGGSFGFVLAVTTCFCSGSFEELEVPSFGLVVSEIEANVINAKEFYKTYNEICC